jgi:hypothetical protein
VHYISPLSVSFPLHFVLLSEDKPEISEPYFFAHSEARDGEYYFLGVKTSIERYGQCMCWCSNGSSRLNSMMTQSNLCVQCTVCVTLYILPLLWGGMLRVVTWISYDECQSQTSCEPLHCTHRLHTYSVGRTVLTHELFNEMCKPKKKKKPKKY